MSRVVVIIYLLAYKLDQLHIPIVPEVINRVFVRLLFSCYVGLGARLGENVRLGYGGLGIVIHKEAIIGNNVVIGAGVTLGGSPRKVGVPVIGDNCTIYNGAQIVGPITIGNNCIVGAGSVVLENVPDECIVAGVPAKIIKREIDISQYR
ncbi:MAG: serine acetyltransferase [Desulfocapsa sp.]|nr:serine acetyltransferase [Desulfocapsa sp.]